MHPDEKVGWIAWLWAMSLATMVWLVGTCMTGGTGEWGAGSPLFIFPIFFGISLVIWILRVTYEAGRRNH